MSDAAEKVPILVVDDHEVTRRLLREVLEKEGYAVSLAASGEKALELLAAETFQIILSDIRMLELDGLAVLREARRADPSAVVILMTGFGSMEGAIEAIREGAFDYVSKPFKIDHLKAVVARAAKHGEALRASTSGKPLPDGRLGAPARALIGKSPRIVEVYKALARAAMSTSTVLVTGESGTGKELVARAIHDNGPRRAKAFVPVNCGALSESGLESVFMEAQGGTLFLDEVSDLAAALQVKLLRALQEGEYKPLGRLDLRVIAATHDDLDALVRESRFREDFFYRLKVILIELPPLRERVEDIPDLVNHFLTVFSARNAKAVSHVSEEGMALLRAYGWPGNVRELEHAIERAVAMTNTSVLFSEDFPPEILRGRASAASAEPGAPSGSPAAPSSLEEMEKAHILKILQDVSFNKSRASEILGIDRATLYRKAQRYGIDLRGKS
ncbi:MAG: sigma-54 dependent transcriptional regulator [Oligoflexia bacterium]|nr:sigma-54 dependent transcriptional regulator [Oligoflexia bacterium]